MNYFESFSEILKQFTAGQRVTVLVLLLVFTTGTYLISKYFQRNSCLPLIKENMEMQKDFAEIAKMLREERKTNAIVESKKTEKLRISPTGRSSSNKLDTINPMMLDSFEYAEQTPPPPASPIIKSGVNEKVLKIAEKYSKE